MHSCDVAVAPPAQGAALLFELGALIIEGRTHKDDIREDHKEDSDKDPADIDQATSVYELKALLVGRLPLRGRTEALWRDHTPMCIEVLLAPDCGLCRDSHLLLERWTMSVYSRWNEDHSSPITSQWLLNAIRSQLHFSQISAWSAKIKDAQVKASPSERQRKLSRETCNFKKYEANCDASCETDSINRLNIVYHLKIPEENHKSPAFQWQSVKHSFPITDIGGDVFLEVTLESLPRLEEIPKVSCTCGAKMPIQRRKSKDHAAADSPSASEDFLARKLDIACSLGEMHSSSCSKGLAEGEDSKRQHRIKRNSPDLSIINSEMGCSSGISRKFSLYSSPDSAQEFSFQALPSRGSTPERSDFNDSGFSCTNACLKAAAAPTKETYLIDYLVDDRMQTPCSQSGKHRCNCDDESDQGVKNGVPVLEGSPKESPKYSRRHRKEFRHKQSSNSGQDRKSDLIINRKVRTCSSSDNSDGRSSPELVHYDGAACLDCRGCIYKRLEAKAPPAIPATTSIPILQASKFDHVNRFGSFRSALHKSLSSREFYSLNCRRTDEEDYRPSSKKYISSYTQTDDVLCECGRSIMPTCFDCAADALAENVSPNRGDVRVPIKMKRSEANHDLAASSVKDKIIKGAGSSSSSLCDDKNVIDLNCDNRINYNNNNNCKCDNNRILYYSDDNFSRTKNSLSCKTPFKYRSGCNSSDSISVGKTNNPSDESSFIRKPKLKRFASALETKVGRVIVDRKEGKLSNEQQQQSDSENGCTKRHRKGSVNKQEGEEEEEEEEDNNETEEDNIVVHEKGDYGTFGKKEEKRDFNHRSISKAIVSTCDHNSVPSVSEKDKFRCILDSAASMVFHSRTGLPLTSSPAPLRRGKSSFDFDSSINSVSGIKSALYGSTDIETPDSNPIWSPGSSPGSPSQIQMEAPIFTYNSNVVPKTQQSHLLNKQNKFRHGTSSGLLGSFEESVLNGRLEPAATVAGFTAEIGASGEFCPPHLTLPVTVFFYSLGDNTTSSPYLGHINLGRKGYCVPRAGTIQVTLFNPHGTVVKMFVVMYDLEDMPPHSRTFLRQRTLWGGTCLRYLIHLRFLTSKSGKVYLHTDIRIIVSRKADLDTAAAHSLNSPPKIIPSDASKPQEKDKEKRRLNRSIGCYELSNCCENRSKCDKILSNLKSKQTNSISSVISKELSYELRSFTYGPENPKYSPR